METPLETIAGWSADQLDRLREIGITTAEQVVAISATENGLRSLSEQLHVPTEETGHLVDLARAQLPPETRAEMERPADTSEYGLGALPPE